MADELNSIDPYQPTPEELNQMFKAMDDSVWVIDNKIANGPGEFQTQAEANAEVERNVGHLEIMLAKPYIEDAGRPLSVYVDAVVNGKKYVADHPAS